MSWILILVNKYYLIHFYIVVIYKLNPFPHWLSKTWRLQMIKNSKKYMSNRAKIGELTPTKFYRWVIVGLWKFMVSTSFFLPDSGLSLVYLSSMPNSSGHCRLYHFLVLTWTSVDIHLQYVQTTGHREHKN